MGGRKRKSDATASDQNTQKPKKSRKKAGATATDADDTNDSEATRRNARSKNFSVPNTAASIRGTQSAKAQGKKVSTAKVITEKLIPIPMEEQRDSDHERVVFLDNDTGEPKFALYRKTEKAEPMAHLWADFLQQVQSARDHIGADIGIFLSEEEAASINLKNNASIFPTLITAKGALRSKDNLDASTTNATRNTGGVFGGRQSAATVTGADILRSRASSMRKKGDALIKQAAAYEKTAKEMDPRPTKFPEEKRLAKVGMTYLEDFLTLNRKEFEKYVIDHEEHLAATAEKLRSEMAGLAHFVHKAEKRLRDQIQLKVAADLKLCQDIKKFGHFEMKAWQMGALPHGSHVCWCNQCVGLDPNAEARTSPTRLVYPKDDGLPQARREDALPTIKLEPEDDDRNLYDATPRASPARVTDANAVNTDGDDDRNLYDASASPARTDANAVNTDGDDDHNNLYDATPGASPARVTDANAVDTDGDDDHNNLYDATPGASPARVADTNINAAVTHASATATGPQAGNDDILFAQQILESIGSAQAGSAQAGSAVTMEPPAGSGTTQANSGVSATATPSHKTTDTGPEDHDEPRFPSPTSITSNEAWAAAEKGSPDPTATSQGDEDSELGRGGQGEEEEGQRKEEEGPTDPTATSQGNEDGEHEGGDQGEEDMLRHNDAAIDRMFADNRVRYPRIAGRGGTGHLRGDLFSDVFEDAKEMEYNAGYD